MRTLRSSEDIFRAIEACLRTLGSSLLSGFVFCAVVAGESHATTFDGIYVLGDSLSDQGNLSIATSPIPAFPLIPDPVHYFNGRFSNGPVYTDLLSQRLGLPLGPSLLGGNDFAFGGARTTYNSVESVLPAGSFPWSLNAETAAFASRHINDPEGLFIVFSGANDITDIIDNNLDPAPVFSTLLAGIQSAVQAFEAAGAQTILVPNVPDLGLIPAYSNSPLSTAATALSAQYDAMLHAQLEADTNANIIEFNTFDWLQKVVSNPEAFGLSNVSTPCYSGFILPDPTATECADPGDYLFWDIEHPTATGQELLATELLAAVEPPAVTVSEPSPMSLIAVALLLFPLTRRANIKRR